MDQVIEIIQKPFVAGLLIGLLLVVYTFLSGYRKNRKSTKEVNKLKEQLCTQMEMNTKGSQAQLDEIEELKQKNENLRMSLSAIKNKPSKVELNTLYLYDRAIHLMSEKAPGFAPAWESALKEAEAEQQKMDTGVLAWTRKIIRPALGNRSSEDDQD